MSRRARWVGLVLALLFLVAPTAARAQEPQAPAGAEQAPTAAQVPSAEAVERVAVAVKPAPPFVLDQDPLSGFSIDLWEETARRAGLETDYLRVDKVGEQLEAVRTGRADAAIAAISITAEREESLDFSKPIFNSGLQVLTRTEDDLSITNVLSSLFSGPVGWLLVIMLVMSLVVGVVVWLVERRDNPGFHRDARHGVFDGLWWAMVTMMTVGYGDRVPRRRAGRVLTILWMIIGVVLVANFTAIITTNLTLSQIRGEVSGVNDLESGSVAAVRGTTSEDFLREIGITAVLVDSANDAFAALEEGDVDAVVYDSPIVRYYAETKGRGRVTVVGSTFEEEYYGIALPSDSPLAERIDQALLAIGEDGTYSAIYTRWFGADE